MMAGGPTGAGIRDRGRGTDRVTGMTAQPGYDALAAAYDEAFPAGFGSARERHAVALLADELLATGLVGPVLDVGCGTGHIAHDLSSRGLDVVGVDPSAAMLSMARGRYPTLRWRHDDAALGRLPHDHPSAAGIVARFSLIHAEPASVPGILARWVELLQPGALVMVAFQCSDEGEWPWREFDHRVARAWRWHPDAMSEAMTAAGLSERWRLVVQPSGGHHRFAECHLLHGLDQ
jgi:trans-aconitate methyltransferase